MNLGTTYHMCVDIAGIMGWPDKNLQTLFATNRSAKSIRCYLRSQLEEGKKVLPIGPKCDAWSDENGCQGHPKEEPPGNPLECDMR